MKRLFQIPLLALVAAAGRAGDFQSWHTISLRWPGTKPVNLATIGQFRLFDDSSHFAFWRVGQTASAEVLPWLQAGLGYRYTETNVGDGEWRHQHRAEFQLTLQRRLSERVNLNLRNRLELRWNEGVREVNERTRHRLHLNVATPRWRSLDGIYFSEEVFYDFDRNTISDNRLVPVGLRFRLHERASLSVQYLVRWRRGAQAWQQDHVLGTELALRL